jgi:hypothetical protein
MALMMAEAGGILGLGMAAMVRRDLSSKGGSLLRDREGAPMDDISAIDGLTNSLRAVAELTKALKDISDPGAIPTTIYELAKEIMSAQSCALAVQSEQFDLAQGKRELEEEIVRLRAWNTERYRYQLQSVGPGANAYVVKETMRGSDPVHWICADCFQIGKKRFLNESHSDLHHVYHKCQECGGKIRIRKTSMAPGQDMAESLLAS